MPKVGDRVIIEGTKVGAQRREGSLVAMTGRLIRVRWSDGSESLLTPGAGAVTFLPASGSPTSRSGAKQGNGKAAAKAASAKAKAPAKAAAGKAGAKRSSGGKAPAKKPKKG